METTIDLDVARKVLETVDEGLSYGIGEPTPGHMCVEAAVCYALGLPHGDDPKCVSTALRELKITLNDARVWRSNHSRALGLRRLALAQLGSAGTLDENLFARRVSKLAVSTAIPFALRAASKLSAKHGDKLSKLADMCELAPTEENATAAADAAWDAARDAARAAANAVVAAAYAADAAVDAAANAVDAAAADAARAAARAAAYATARDADGEQFLMDYCESVVQILIEMDAPGCQWLYLTEQEVSA